MLPEVSMTCGSLRLGGFLIAAVVVGAGLVAAAPSPGKESATATLAGPKGEAIGEAVLTQTPHGVLVTATLHDLTPGPHGFHIHEHGECTAPFTSAGGHFNPSHLHHGYENDHGPHAGDLPNVIVPDSGSAKVEFMAYGVTLRKNAPTSLLDKDGSALVVHAGPDDYRSDPAGNSGDRVACGVIDLRATEPTAAAPRARPSP
jgi:Cu-Zn family superoxide dismutase